MPLRPDWKKAILEALASSDIRPTIQLVGIPPTKFFRVGCGDKLTLPTEAYAEQGGTKIFLKRPTTKVMYGSTSFFATLPPHRLREHVMITWGIYELNPGALLVTHATGVLDSPDQDRVYYYPTLHDLAEVQTRQHNMLSTGIKVVDTGS